MMARVLGIGGIFYKTASPEATREWYARVLGLQVTPWGGVKFAPLPVGATVWSPFAEGTKHFAPSTLPFMINFVVEDLAGVLAHAAAEGVESLSVSNDDQFGRFAWLMDPDGMKVELWEPAAAG